MRNDEYYLGIDIGTSSIKGVALFKSFKQITFKADYEHNIYPDVWEEGFYNCVQKLVNAIGFPPRAISICSQVGTYIFCGDNQKAQVHMWNEVVNSSVVQDVIIQERSEFWIQEISMNHPPIESYPLASFTRLRQTGSKILENSTSISAIKDYIYRSITGASYSDPYTWRGLASIEKCCYSKKILEKVELVESQFPELAWPWEAPGTINDATASRCGLKKGTPVFLGCNDFYASLVGIGVGEYGDAFDVTGTSEHIGRIVSQSDNEKLVSSPYFNRKIEYGVTASSGTSIKWAHDNINSRIDDCPNVLKRISEQKKCAPIFLPYLKGERAPVWNSCARGVFFGLSDGHTATEMFYSVIEGVAFTIAHNWEMMELTDNITAIRVGGGFAHNTTGNMIKSSLMRKELIPMAQEESGALGMAILSMFGSGELTSLYPLPEKICITKDPVEPDVKLYDSLYERYIIFKNTYNNLQENFIEWNKLK